MPARWANSNLDLSAKGARFEMADGMSPPTLRLLPTGATHRRDGRTRTKISDLARCAVFGPDAFVLLGVIVIKIVNKDGSTTEIGVPEGSLR